MKRRRIVGKKRRIFFLCLELIFVLIMIVSGIKILQWVKDNNKNKDIIEKISETIVVDEIKDVKDEKKYTVDFKQLKLVNSDIVGFLTVEGTNIKYPVVKTTNNEFYLTHNLQKEENTAGWIFMDYKNLLDGTDKNIVIYGHSRKDGSMFGTLWHTTKSEWLNNYENRYVTFVTPTKTYIYEVFSVYTIKAEDYYVQTYFEDGQFEGFINTLKSRSIYDFKNNVTKDDQIITLSTCYLNDDNRMVMHAKKIVN